MLVNVFETDLTGGKKMHTDNQVVKQVGKSKVRGAVIGAVSILTAVTMIGCSSLKTPATADVAVSNAAVSDAAGSGAAEFAPVEMQAARDKMARANKALADKDYALARDLANAAQADAKLAQSKANSAKAQTAADAIQNDLRVLREEINRAGK